MKNLKLVLTDSDEQCSDYKLKNEADNEISSYTVEKKDEKALISYSTDPAFRNQGYASMGLKLLKGELFKSNSTLILELINLSGDYSRKVAENAGFFSPTDSIDYYVTLHPFAEDILEVAMQQFERGTPEFTRRKKLLKKIKTLRKQQQATQIKLANKLDSLKAQVETADDESYKKYLSEEIRNLERILGSSKPTENER